MSRLAAAMRELRTATGLSLAGLAAKTPYSKSSWERYLNGKTLPPREAVEELCRLAGEPEGRCVALWEIAEAETSGRATQAPPVPPVPAVTPQPPPPPPPPAPEHRGVAALAVLASVCAVAVSAVVVAVLLLPEPHTSAALSPTAATSPGPGCRGAACEGRNPMAMYCAPRPETLATHRTATGAWMELRYSKECGASWARTWDGRVGDRIEMTAAGQVRGAAVGNAVAARSYVYTPMTATGPGTVVRACLRPAAGAGKKECFDARVP
ncbi:helix-turn-helix domain-containing protein [Streptomyces sp. NPDC088350]|uniref:helix-turn-helix domain-containing protein n=1 Tax=Streptomyces sp. NPDC088350 TaxID=3365854 RepID=UPI00381F5C51